MTAFKVKASAHFEEDLTSAYRYYRKQAGPNNAAKFLDEYDLTVSRLQAMPTAAVKIGDTGLRWCPIGSFTAVFSIAPKKRIVILERLFYMTSDWKRLILTDGGLDDAKMET